MNRTTLLKADAAINLILGILLMAFPAGLVKALGIPMADPSFYATILAWPCWLNATVNPTGLSG
jgi:hypothetical protein